MARWQEMYDKQDRLTFAGYRRYLRFGRTQCRRGKERRTYLERAHREWEAEQVSRNVQNPK